MPPANALATHPSGDWVAAGGDDHVVEDRDAEELAGPHQAAGQLDVLPAGLRVARGVVVGDHDGRRLPATYANFLLIKDAVLLPTYGVAQDAEAHDILQCAFPRRSIIGIDCREIIRQNGSLHCLTMQFPAQVGLNDTLAYSAA